MAHQQDNGYMSSVPQHSPKGFFNILSTRMGAGFEGKNADKVMQDLAMNDQLMRQREQGMHLAAMKAQALQKKSQDELRKTQMEMNETIQDEASKYSDWIAQRPDQIGQVVDSIVSTTGADRARVLTTLGLGKDATVDQAQSVFGMLRSRATSTAKAEQALELEGLKQTGATKRKLMDITSDQYMKEREFSETKSLEMRTQARAQADQKYAEYTEAMIGSDDTKEVAATSLTGIQAALPKLFEYNTLEFDAETGLPENEEAGKLNIINSVVAQNALAASREDLNRYRMATTQERAQLDQQGKKPRDITSYLRAETTRIVGRIDDEKVYYPPGPRGQDAAEFTKIRDEWIKKHYNSSAFQDEIRIQITQGTTLLKASKEYREAMPMEQAAMEKDLDMKMHNAMKGKATSDFSDPVARGFAQGSEFDPTRKMGSGLYAI